MNKEWGYIKSDGTKLTEFVFNKIEWYELPSEILIREHEMNKFVNLHAIVAKNFIDNEQNYFDRKVSTKVWNYANDEGKPITGFEYDSISIFSENLERVGKYELIPNPEFDPIEDDEYYKDRFIKNMKFGFIDDNGKVVIPFKFMIMHLTSGMVLLLLNKIKVSS